MPTGVHPENDLYTLSATYIRGVEEAGGLPLLLPFADDTTAPRILDGLDGLVMTGGRDVDPANYGREPDGAVEWDAAADASDTALIRAALAVDLPTLYICRGIQILNTVLGGTLHQHIWGSSADHPSLPRTGDALVDAEVRIAHRHLVSAAEGSRLAGIFGATEIETNSLHHQSLDEVAVDLTVVGRSGDGQVEAIESPGRRLVGVQWHPERQLDEGHDALFEWLVAEAS